MVVLDTGAMEILKVNCPKCGGLMIMGSVKNKNLNIVQLIKNGVSYICVKCVGKVGDFYNG